MRTVWTLIKYICSNPKCKAEDHDKIQADKEQPIPVFNCWRCGNGRGLSPVEMMERRKGMFPQVSELASVN